MLTILEKVNSEICFMVQRYEDLEQIPRKCVIFLLSVWTNAPSLGKSCKSPQKSSCRFLDVVTNCDEIKSFDVAVPPHLEIPFWIIKSVLSFSNTSLIYWNMKSLGRS